MPLPIADNESITDLYSTLEESEDLITPIDAALAAAEMWIEEGSEEAAMTIQVYEEHNPDKPGNTPQTFCFAFEPSQYTKQTMMEYVRDTYGSGTYWHKSYTQKGKLIFNRRFAVKNVDQDREKEDKKHGVVLPPVQNNANMIMQMMQKSEERMMAVLERMAQNNQQPAVQMPNMMDMLGMLGTAKELFSGGGGTNNIDAMMKGIEMAKELGGGSDKETNTNDLLMTTLREFAPAIVKSISEMPNKNPPVRTANPIVKTNPGEPVKPVETDVKLTPQQAQMAQQAAFLVERAKVNADPGIYADMLLDMMPNITELLGGQSIVPLLLGLNPEVASYMPWFDELNSMLSEPAEDTSTTDLEMQDLTSDTDLSQNDQISDDQPGDVIIDDQSIDDGGATPE